MPAAETAARTTSRVVILNGLPGSGKSTLAHALQDALDEPWVYASLDTFVPRLPLRRTQSPEVVDRLIRGISGSVAAIAEAGNDLILELVVRRSDPVNNFALAGLLERLMPFRVVVVCLRCSLATAVDREQARPAVMRGLAERDYGRIDEDSCDVLIDTDAHTVEEAVTVVRNELAVWTTGGEAARRLLARIGNDLEGVDPTHITLGRDEEFLPTLTD